MLSWGDARIGNILYEGTTPTFAVTMLAVLLAASMGVDTRTTVMLFAAVFSGQLVVGWTNDLVDREWQIGIVGTAGPASWCRNRSTGSPD